MTEPLPAETASPLARRRWLGWLASGLLVAVIAGLAVMQLARTGADPAGLARAYGFDIGNFPAISERSSEPAPEHRGPAVGGGELSLGEFRGTVVLVNFWASWCGPCRREQPELERVWRAYRDRGVLFVGPRRSL